MIVLNGEEGLECEVHVDGIHLQDVPNCTYFVCVLEETSTDVA